MAGSVYRIQEVTVSLAELQLNVQPCGEIGNYLYQQMVDFNNTFYQSRNGRTAKSGVSAILRQLGCCWQRYSVPTSMKW